MIDTYELLTPLDSWLRETFLPQLPADTLVVIAGRNRPAPAWRSDIAWAGLIRLLPLRNLRPEESQTYLTVQGIPAALHAGVLAFTHGHPLALSLVAEVINQGDELSTFNPQAEPDVVRVLLERFTRNVPGPQHRQALEICAHVWVTTEALLVDVLGVAVGHELFAWLRERSFIEQGLQGLFPHDLAREVLDADLRWRNPRAYQTMHRDVRRYFERLSLQSQGQRQLPGSADLIYLNHRYNPITKSFFDFGAVSQAYTEPATAEDHPLILEMVERHEGVASVEIARYWLQRQPQAFTIFRSHRAPCLGFMAMLTLPAITAADAKADPAMAAAQRFIQRHGPLHPDEELDYVRFWMGRETYQVADTQTLVAMTAVATWRSNPRLAWSFASLADPAYWQSLFTFINFAYTQDADFRVTGHRFGVFTHDWRAEPVSAWSEAIEARQLGMALPPAPAATSPSPPLLVLSQPEFAEAVRQALRDYTRPDMLAANPLMRSRLVVEAAKSSPTFSTEIRHFLGWKMIPVWLMLCRRWLYRRLRLRLRLSIGLPKPVPILAHVSNVCMSF